MNTKLTTEADAGITNEQVPILAIELSEREAKLFEFYSRAKIVSIDGYKSFAIRGPNGAPKTTRMIYLRLEK